MSTGVYRGLQVFPGVYLCASLVAMRLDTFLRMPPPLSMIASVLVWLRCVSVPTRKPRAPSTEQISALFSVQ